MREILFRGKRIDNGEWIYGDLLHGHHISSGEEITQIYNHKSTLRHRENVVVPETVGQYSGLTDKNGTKIFEGDIIHREYTLTGERKTTREGQIGAVVFKKGEFRANVVKGKGNWFSISFVWKGDYIEVIGNIHDNPELLDGKGEDNG